jgi:hypothetical protein
MVFGGRINQKASIEAASEGDRGAVERLANAFDAALTAARVVSGTGISDSSLTPRRAAQRFLNPNADCCDWNPQYSKIDFEKPIVQFWREDVAKRRFKRFQSGSSLCSLLDRDTSLGIGRKEMPQTILALNSESKLRTWEAIGQFGHGDSSSLAFCESCLIVTQPRSGNAPEDFYWTLIFPEAEPAESKQSVVFRWFADQDGLPLTDQVSNYPALSDALPGTSIWHFGDDRGDWVKTAVGTHQDTPAGRLGRLLFSYPLPFRIQGQLARGETETGSRTVKLAKEIPFLGRDALLALRSQPLKKRLVCFTVDDSSVVLLGRETIYRDGERVGWLSSGGWGYTVAKNIGFGYVRNEKGVDDAMLHSGSYELEVAAERMACTLHRGPLYDPRAERVKRSF